MKIYSSLKKEITMKFKNENDRFEWEVLELNEEEYVKKINLLNPFKENQSFFNFTSAREKWNEAVKGKRFIRKIKKSLEILNNKNLKILKFKKQGFSWFILS